MSRILLSAYACEPGKGSEPEVGWMWATGLEAAGHEVWVITREANRALIERALGERGRPGLHFAYHDLPAAFRKWKGGRGVHWYYAFWQWGAYRLARQLTKNVRFDCVQHVKFVGLRGPCFMGQLGLPFILGPVSGGESVPLLLRQGMSRTARIWEIVRGVANSLVKFDPVMRRCFRRAERILVATAESRELVPRPFQGKCQVQLGVGLSREYLAWAGPHRKPVPRKLRLLYAGRLLEWKGVHLALLAIRELRARAVDVVFTIVGEGPAQRDLEELAVELRIDDAVRWSSWIPQSELTNYYQQHDVLLFPSLRDSGGMVVLEALAHGLPVVCTDRGGPGVIVSNQCGRVVTTRSRSQEEVVARIADDLLELSRDRVLLNKLSRTAKTRAWQFDFQNVITQLHPRAEAQASS